MRTAILLVLFFAAIAMADKSQFRSQLSSLLNMQAKAVDAIDSALNLLRDLKQTNVDAQAKADEINRTMETNLGKQIADLLAIADYNKENGNAATAQLKFIEEEIKTTQEYLVWINNRRTEIHRKKEELRQQRCYANMMFIKSLKEHQEALQVIKFLREDVFGIVGGEGVNLSEIKDATRKLSTYAQLFNAQALQEFTQLTEYVDPKTAEHDVRSDDNDKGALEMERMGATNHDVVQRVLDAIDKLEKHLEESIKNLEENEIKAAWDLSQWLQDSEAELIHLDQEQAKKTTYIDKLLISQVAAKAHEDQAWAIYFESAATYNDAVADLEAKRQWYMQEKTRRDEENMILDEIIKTFIDKVSSIDSGMRGKVNDVSEDGSFDTSSVIGRRTQSTFAKDAGKLAENVAAEAGF